MKKGSTNAGDFGDDDEEDDVGFVHGKKKNMIAFLPAQGKNFSFILEFFLIHSVCLCLCLISCFASGLDVVRLFYPCSTIYWENH